LGTDNIHVIQLCKLFGQECFRGAEHHVSVFGTGSAQAGLRFGLIHANRSCANVRPGITVLRRAVDRVDRVRKSGYRGYILAGQKRNATPNQGNCRGGTACGLPDFCVSQVLWP
jgi:hypothetical protein